MKNIPTPYSKFHLITSKLILVVFIFTTCFSGLPTKSYADTGEITYITSYDYDFNGNVTSRVTPDGKVIKYLYDNLNRVKHICYLDNITTECTAIIADVSYTYDANGNRTSMTDSNGTRTTDYVYDRFNRVREVWFPDIDPILYEYDKNSNLTKITYPDGKNVSYGYDDDNRLETVTNATSTTVYEYYADTGKLKKKTLPNGVYTEYIYNFETPITLDVINKKSDHTKISSYHYVSDANNNIIHVDATSSAVTKSIDYAYDKLNRLTNATSSDTTFEAYTYDNSGNRRTKTTQDGTINYEYDLDNRLISAGSSTSSLSSSIFFYDNSGNLVKKMSPDKTVTYKYDHENRLTEYSDGMSTVEFEYDGDGNRISKTVNGVKTNYINNVLSPVTQVLLETKTSQHIVTNKYTYGYSRISQTQQATSFYLYDSPGRSATALVDSSENILNSYEYDSFGNIKAANETVGNSFKYVGEQYDEETGLVFLRNRYYDPEIGRFISKDPFPGYVSAPQTKNPYPYVGNNPVNFIDPSGEKAFWYHFFDGLRAGFLMDMGVWDSLKFGFEVMWVDITEMDNARLHSTALNPKEPSTVAILEAKDYADQMWEAGKPEYAVHTWGDIPTHNGEYFPGSSDIGATILHTIKDAFTPGSFQEDIASNINRLSLGLDDGVGELNTILPQQEYQLNYNRPDWGGVSLSTTAQIMLNSGINDIAGVAYDQATGQIILYGKQSATSTMPDMDLDDLAVAIRSVYGYGGQDPQDPGVSIGTEPSEIEGQMKVRYDGHTTSTDFGYTMFESDRILKTLILGKDNITESPVIPNVLGYKSMLTRYVENGGVPGGESADRMWFVPEQITLKQSDDDTSMVFDTVKMELLTESKFQDGVVDNPIAEEFAEHFTDNYDNFAADEEFPILKDLETLGKITAVVKWIRDNNIPFDLSFFENYTPNSTSTPEYTPEISDTDSGITITGGVKYLLDASNFATSTDIIADEVKQDALDTRYNQYSETDFSWNFTSGGEDYTAVAHSLTRSKKDGNIKRTEVDLAFPVEGNNPLALVRYYNSFNDKTTGFGYGWDMMPYKLRFAGDKRLFTFGDQSIIVNAYYELFVTEGSNEYLYRLYSISNDDQPLYSREGGQYALRDNLDDTFTLFKNNRGTVDFDSAGKLTRVTDNNGIYIDYNYTGSDLTSIDHQNGRTITLYYANNRVEYALGPGSKRIDYTYDGNNNLWKVTNEANEYITYTYDAEMRLDTVVDPRQNTVFQAGIDDYSRATSQTIGLEAEYSTSFDLASGQSTINNQNNVDITQHFNEDYRLTDQTGSEARVEMTYATSTPVFGPLTVTKCPSTCSDCSSCSIQRTTEYEYDDAGNVKYIKDAEGSERRFLYDVNNNLVIARDARGFDTVFIYDDKNRLFKIWHDAAAEVDVNGEFTGNATGDPNNVTEFEYDDTVGKTGNILSITDPENRWQNFSGHVNGMAGTTTYPSDYQITNTYDTRTQSLLEDTSNPGGEYVSYEYYANDRVKTVTTVAGTVTYTYDANGNLDKVYDAKHNPDPENLTTVIMDYDYDDNNNLIKVTDAEGGETNYLYDTVNNLLTQITLPNGSIKELKYDTVKNLELRRPNQIIYRVTNTEPNAAVLVDTLDVGSTTIDSTTQQTLPICNVGNGTLNITDITTDNPNFTVDITTATLAPGECLDLLITFNGTAIGSESATLTIYTDDADQPTITVTLTGNVTLDSLNPRAYSERSGIHVYWDAYSGSGVLDHYDVYRATSSPITDINAPDVTLIATNASSSTDYLDLLNINTDLGNQYYYAPVAFDASSNSLTITESVGPITFLNLGKIGNVINVATSTPDIDEKSVDIAYNSSSTEFLLVYEYDASGTAGTNYDIYGQIVSEDGQVIGMPFSIMSTSNNEKNPQVVYNSSSTEYMVVAEYDSPGAGHYQIRAQRIDALSYALQGGPVDIYYALIGQYSPNDEFNPGIAWNSSGNQYLVGFESDYTGEGDKDVIWFMLDSTGSPLTYYGTAYGSGYGVKNPDVVFKPAGPTSTPEFYSVYMIASSTPYYFVQSQRLDPTTGEKIGIDNTLTSNPEEISLPDVIYNPDREEYAIAYQFDYLGDAGDEYSIEIQTRNLTGDLKAVEAYSSSGDSFKWPDLTYYGSQGEYLLSFTREFSGGDSDIQALRVSVVDLNKLTDNAISVANESSSVEQKSCVVFNDDREEFLIGYEYNNGTDWDVRAQRVGIVTGSLDISPTDLDFGAGTVTDPPQQDTIYTSNFPDEDVLMVNSTSEPWLSVSPSSLTISGVAIYEWPVSVTVDRAGLAVENYSGDVFINFNGFVYTVPVTMEVANSAPNTPSNPMPADGATDQADLGSPLTVTMSWECSDPDTDQTLTYDVYFSDDQALVNSTSSSVLVSDDQASTSYTSATSTPLQYDTTYYWRVEAKDDYTGGPASTLGDVWSFTTVKIPAPVLNEYTPDPTNNTRPILSWNAVQDAAKYHIQIADNDNFSPVLEENSNVTSTNYTLGSDLPEGTIYWRVASIDNIGQEGAYSADDVFTVDITAPAIPELTAYTPDPTSNQRPTLEWSVATTTSTVNYHIQISDSQSLLIDTYVQGTPYVPTLDLPDGNITWKVSSIDAAGNESNFSAPDNFVIDVTPPDQIIGLNAVQEDVDVKLTWDQFVDSDGDFNNFNIYRSTSQIDNVSLLTPVNPSITDPNTTTYLDTTVTPRETYYYAVTAVDSLGNENKSVIDAGPVEVIALADLNLSMTVDDLTPNTGETVTFDITVMNNGPDTETNVKLKDILPSGLTHVTSTPSIGTYDDINGVWDMGDLLNNASSTLQIKATVDQSGRISNIAGITASYDSIDPDSSDNSAGIVLNGGVQADLAIDNTVDNPVPSIGETVTFTINITNNGLDAATGVQVTDLLPAGLTYQSDVPSQGTYDSGTGLWDIGSLGAGAGADLELQATVDDLNEIISTANITQSSQTDPDITNNSKSVVINQDMGTHPSVVDLSVQKTVNHDVVDVGNNAVFTVVVRNNNYDDAYNVEISDILPAGLVYVSSSVSKGSYDDQTGVWDVGMVLAGSYVVMDIEAQVPNIGSETNTASVGNVNDFDLNNANDSGSATVTGGVPDISALPVSHDFGVVNVGNTSGAQTFTVSNDGNTGLNIGTVSISGTDTSEFATQSDFCSGQTVAPSGTCTVDVVFFPASTGAKSANLSVPSNDPDENPLDIPLSGSGNALPVADAGGPYTEEEGQTVTLNGGGSSDADGFIAQYEWDIDNNGTYDYIGTSASTTQAHTYTDDGTYTVKLRVTDNLGAAAVATSTVTITDSAPAAVFTASVTSGDEPLTVDFTDSSTAYDQPVTYAWDFGDGNTSTAQNPSNTYTQDGIYTALLTVTDSDGSTGSATTTITVNDTGPTANFTGLPTSGPVPLTVDFSDLSTGHDQPLTYGWDFGDGGTSTEQNPGYIFTQCGNYTITLTVTDADVDTDTLIRTNYITGTTPPVKIVGENYYYTLQEAYNAALDNDIILGQDVSLTAGDFNLNVVKTITLRGGYDCDYIDNTGVIILNGDMKVGEGKLTIDSGKLKID